MFIDLKNYFQGYERDFFLKCETLIIFAIDGRECRAFSLMVDVTGLAVGLLKTVLLTKPRERKRKRKEKKIESRNEQQLHLSGHRFRLDIATFL